MLETRRLPAGGAGPAPERLFCGSEGALGVITRAWVRLQERAAFRAGASVLFERFEDAVEATRAVAQSSLRPANCRLLDRVEALLSGSGDGTSAILVLGFESADRPLDAELAHADGALPRSRRRRSATTRRQRPWRSAFLRLPYVYEALVRLGMLAGSVETAVTWDRFEELHAGVTAALADAGRAACGGVLVACRFAYVYPDGPAPYYTFVAPARAGAELEQWDAIKGAVSRAILDHGGTITHHHAVGRDHRPWYDEERPELFAGALRAAKHALDPGRDPQPGRADRSLAVACAWCACTTAWPLPRAISQRLTGNATAPAIRSATARLPQKSTFVRPASIAPGIQQHDRVVDDLHHRDRDRVRGERERDRPPRGRARREQRQHRQRVAEEEREHDRERDRLVVAPAERGADDHAEHLADRAAGEAVDGRAEGEPVEAQTPAASFSVSPA